MQAHTIVIPDHISKYVYQRLDGHLEKLEEYVVGLIEQEHQKQQAKLQLNSLLSEPKAAMDVEDVFIYTLVNFVEKQANAYLQSLEKQFYYREMRHAGEGRNLKPTVQTIKRSRPTLGCRNLQ